MKIYLDMDGVLVDFDRGLLEQFGVENCLVTYGTPDKDKTPEQWALSNKVWGCMNTPKFFRNLPPMHGFNKLWEAARKLTKETYVLTAFPNGVNKSNIGGDKWDWLNQHIPGITTDQFIFCERRDKAKYASVDDYNPDHDSYHIWPNILVDDLPINCEEWERAGGKSILFKNKTMDEIIWSMEVAYGT